MTAVFTNKETHTALVAILEGVAAIPDAAHRAWENEEFVRTPGEPYIEEEYVPAAQSLLTTTRGISEHRGLFVVKHFGVSGEGDDAIHTVADAILAAFFAGSSHAMESGLTLRVRGDVAPYAGQITPVDGGFSYCAITVPWRVYAPSVAS